MANIKPREGVPLDAKLVFKGVIFEVWQWEQEMFDGTKQIFEKIWRPPTVDIIAIVGDKIILEHQDQPDRKNSITLPSGRADQSDDMLSEAKRELLEETGYVSKDWSQFLSFKTKGKVIWNQYCFIARNCNKIQDQNLDSGEKIIIELISFEQFIDLCENPKFWSSLEFMNYLKELKSNSEKKEELKNLLFIKK